MSPSVPVVDDWGRVLVASDALRDLLYRGIAPDTLAVLADAQTDEYNRWCRTFGKGEHAIPPLEPLSYTPEQAHAARVAHWFIPPPFDTLDVQAELLTRCRNVVERDRVLHEMDLFEAQGLLPLLRMMAALVHHFRSNGIVWGVGRGSSCASYCLYLLNVHRVDSLRYDLDISEFLKP